MQAANVRCATCRVAIPVKKFHDKPEQDIEDWYELGKNDFASDLGTVSTFVLLAFGLHVSYLVQPVNGICTAQLNFRGAVHSTPCSCACTDV